MWLENIFDYLTKFNEISVLFRIFLAMLFGTLTGLDRTRKRRPAGFRTYSLVCLGAALTMLVGQYIINVLHIVSDPARIGAQVVSGVGFLGAGTILLKSKSQVVGLTTAAGLWASACLGLVIGIGFYLAAFAGLLAIIFIETFMHKINENIAKKTRIISLYLELSNTMLGCIMAPLKERGVFVSEIENMGGKEDSIMCYTIILNISKQCKLSRAEIIKFVTNIDGIVFCDEFY